MGLALMPAIAGESRSEKNFVPFELADLDAIPELQREESEGGAWPLYGWQQCSLWGTEWTVVQHAQFDIEAGEAEPTLAHLLTKEISAVAP